MLTKKKFGLPTLEKTENLHAVAAVRSEETGRPVV